MLSPLVTEAGASAGSSSHFASVGNPGVRRSRPFIYGLANITFLLYLLTASLVGPNSSPRLVYLALLFPICSSPILVVRQLNDRYIGFTAFLFMYFISFGMLDALNLVNLVPGSMAAGPLTASELLIVLGGLCFVAGYLVSSKGTEIPNRKADGLAKDWSLTTLVLMGLFFWAAGTAANWYWLIVLTVRSGEFHNDTGGLGTTVLMLGRYVQPLGIMIIAYAYTKSRSRNLLLLTVAIASLQVAIGFVSNSKEGAMIGGLLVILIGVLVRARIPKMWALAAALFIVFGFPVFQAYRAIVVGQQGMSNAYAARHIVEALKLSLENEKLVASDFGGDPNFHAQTALERATVKGSVDMIVSRVGKDVAYQYGHTLEPLLFVFIPRLIWPEKLDVQTGELVNTQFQVTGEGVTYISPSHLGDLYWNFGWPGALAGMLGLGLVLGWINRRCDLTTGVSVTRVLILAVSIYELCVRFEGSIASEYPVWIRSVVGILILHALFAREYATARGSATDSVAGAALSPLQFPNLMR